jgi:hypothetical protein
MAEFQWWLLLVGLVAGGGLVAVVTMDGKRREQDLSELERQAETNWIAGRLSGTGQGVDALVVDAVLRLHREYLGMPPPDAILVEGDDVGDPAAGSTTSRSYDWLDRDPDGVPDEVRDDGRGRADEDLAPAREEEPASGQEAHAGADGEQRADR